jgi:lipopolysaccharide export system protein LptA
MKRLLFLKKKFFLFCLLFAYMHSHAQHPNQTDTAGRKQIIIIHSDKIGFKQTDSLNKFQLLVGNVAVQQEKTKFYCDSAALNTTTNVMEAFGHVHINDNDSLQIYSDYLKYFGHEKKAMLTGNVKLTDGKGVLTTNQLDYDLNTKIGIYSNGGKVVNGETVLTSGEGYYYEQTRDVHFKKNVVLIDPQYTIKTDTLLYNTYTEVSTFIVPTEITSDSGRNKINTINGYYDTKNKRAYFGQRPKIWNGGTYIEADEVANDDSTGYGEAKGNVIYRDTVQKVTILANHMNTNRKENSFLATEKPLMIIQQEEDDSLFIAADTLYSARISDLRKTRNVPDVVQTVSNKTSVSEDSVQTVEDSVEEETNNDSTLIRVDSIKARTAPILALKDTTLSTKDSTHALRDTTQSKGADSTDRFFEAYYHVRIYSDSLQAVGDSLFYSAEDSVFRLFNQPVVWTRESQVTGDTIYLYTQNKKPKRMYVFENALTINKVGSMYYNQVKGRTMNAYFENGNIVYSRTKGNSESIYYAQDDENKFIGVNKATADIIDMYFEDKKPQRVVFRSNLVGTSYPMRQVNHEELRLRGFQWLEDIRPKSKDDLFTEHNEEIKKENNGNDKSEDKGNKQ